MIKIEYKIVEFDKNLSIKEKAKILHNSAYLLLDEMLKNVGVFEYEIKKTDSGKPYIENSNIHFSIAHSGGMVCCVLSDKECGIDCEKIAEKDNIKKFCERYFVGDEITIMEKCGYDSREFLKIWTQKEAIGKRLGCGLMKSLKIDSTKENCSTIIENGYIITVNV